MRPYDRVENTCSNPMPRHEFFEFQGDTVKFEQALVFTMKTDADSENCAFCAKVYDDDGRWDVLQCGEMTKAPNEQIVCFSVCSQCRGHSGAVEFIRNCSSGLIYLKNVSNDGMYLFDSCHDKNY